MSSVAAAAWRPGHSLVVAVSVTGHFAEFGGPGENNAYASMHKNRRFGRFASWLGVHKAGFATPWGLLGLCRVVLVPSLRV